MAKFPSTHASLLLRLRDPRDGDAWREFVRLYASLVYGYARKRGLQDADAADLTQDVLGAVAGAVSRLDYDPVRGSFRNWLFTIVRNKLLNLQAAQKNRVRGSGDTATQELLQQCPASETADEAEWEAEWQSRLFRFACERVKREVTDCTWQAFWRTYVDGISVEKVSAELGITSAAVYIARSRVIARLKALVHSVQES